MWWRTDLFTPRVLPPEHLGRIGWPHGGVHLLWHHVHLHHLRASQRPHPIFPAALVVHLTFLELLPRRRRLVETVVVPAAVRPAALGHHTNAAQPLARRRGRTPTDEHHLSCAFNGESDRAHSALCLRRAENGTGGPMNQLAGDRHLKGFSTYCTQTRALSRDIQRGQRVGFEWTQLI